MTLSHVDNLAAERRNRAMREFDENLAKGMPLPGELAHRMTKPKQAEAMHQVFVDIKGEAGSRPVSPKFFGQDGQEACARIMEALNGKICLGGLKGWGNVRIETAIHTPMS